MGLRERKKAETRAALSWAAVRLAVERGLDGVKVEDIAEAAGVSPRTFNNYFGSKGEAIAARHLDRLLRIAAELRRRPRGEPLWEAVTRAATSQLEPGPEVAAHPVQDPAAWAAGVRRVLADPVLQGEMLRAGAVAEAELAVVVAGRTGTDADRDLYPRLVAAVVLAALTTVTSQALRGEAPVPLQRLLTDALAQVAAGLPPPA